MTLTPKLQKLLKDHNIALDSGNEAEARIFLAKATSIYRRRAKTLRGNVTAQFELAREAAVNGLIEAREAVIEAYRTGRGIEPDQVKAYEWLSLSSGDDPRLAYDLALAYQEGRGTAKDYVKFFRHMEDAAKRGDNWEAMFALMTARSDPKYGPPSDKEAIRWAGEMAARRVPAGLTELAHRLKEGRGIEANAEEAFRIAGDAARLAQDAWDKRSSETRYDWAYEDLPEALLTLSRFNKNLNSTEEMNYLNQAVFIASEAMDYAKSRSDRVGPRLLEIMYLGLARREQDRLEWFNFLLRLKNGIDQVAQYPQSRSQLSSELKDVLRLIANALRDGDGTTANARGYREALKAAAEMGSERAMYEYAQLLGAGQKRTESSEYLERAAKAGLTEAYLFKQLKACFPESRRFTRAHELFKQLLAAIVEIKDKAHRVDPNSAKDGVAHYTKGAALREMLSLQSTGKIGLPLYSKTAMFTETQTLQSGELNNLVRLSSIAQVNDPHEGLRLIRHRLHGEDNPLDFYYSESGTKSIVSPTEQGFAVFLGSFSTAIDALDLWRFYGDDGAGYCVITPFECFNTSAKDLMSGAWSDAGDGPQPIALYSVLYEDSAVEEALRKLKAPLEKLKQFIKLLDDNQANVAITLVKMITSDLTFLYKDVGYKAEAEVRAIQARPLGADHLRQQEQDNSSFSRLYLETRKILFKSDGSSIIIGPKVPSARAVRLDIQNRLNRFGWGHCQVMLSKQPYR